MDPGAVEVDHGKLGLRTVADGEDVAHGEIAVDDSGVVKTARVASELLEKGKRLDVGERPGVGFVVETVKKLADLARVIEPPGDKERRPVEAVGLHQCDGFRGFDPGPQQLLGNPPAAGRFAAAEPPVESISPTLVAELFDHHRNEAIRRRHVGGVEVVAAPVDGGRCGDRVDEPLDLGDDIVGAVGAGDFAVQAIARECLKKRLFPARSSG